jgi:Flp pilus assembly protein TadD
LIGVASVDERVAGNYMADDRAERFAAAEAKLTKALSLAPNKAWAHYWMCLDKVQTNRGVQGIAECERALALNPNLAGARAAIGYAKLVNGHAEETESHELGRAARQSSRYACLCLDSLYRRGQAVSGRRRGSCRVVPPVDRNEPESPRLHVLLAAALEELGRVDEARAETQAALPLDPTFTVRRFHDGAPSDNPVFLKQRERAIEAMRKAGLPEG